MTDKKALDIVIPVYNERKNVKPLMEEITESLSGTRDFTVIFVDDGSTDGTTKIVRELASNRDSVVSLHFKRNRGQSAAFAAGFEEASNPLVATIDGDRQNDPADIPVLLDEMESSEVDCVLGYREQRQDSLKKKVGSYIANGFRNWVLGEAVKDTGCSLKLFTREVVESFTVFHGMHRFFPSLVQMNGFSHSQVATSHRPRSWGETKYSIAGRLRQVVFDLIGVAWLKERSIETHVDDKFE
ncbi:MAG: glycosyltransferase family 2 protein [bacterium]